MARKDWTLLAVAAADGQPLTPVQLQKSLFMLGRNLPHLVGIDFYNFEPYDYGPFDASVYVDVGELAGAGLLVAQRVPGRSWSEYLITPNGMQRANQFAASAPASAVQYLRDIVAWARALNFQQLVTTIYRLYPEQRARSVFRD